MTSVVRYAIGDLARLAGVSRRTVRYYVQEELIPPPLGVGRGNHYGPEHLEQILRVKAMQEAGRTLDEIRRETTRRGAAPVVRTSTSALRATVDKWTRPARLKVAPEPQQIERSLWRRLTLAPGVELHVAGNVRLPSPGKLQELAAWCRLHLRAEVEQEDEGNDE